MACIRPGIALVILISGLVAAPPPAFAKMRASDSERGPKLLGIGYKLGNGIGFLGGNLVVNPVPHLSLDLMAAPFSGGFALAPEIKGYLGKDNYGPYLGAGMQYLNTSIAVLDTPISVTGLGAFGNLGWSFGVPLGPVDLAADLGIGAQTCSR